MRLVNFFINFFSFLVLFFGLFLIYLVLIEKILLFPIFVSINLVALIVSSFIAISFLVSGIFLLKRKGWARTLVIIQFIYITIVGLKGVKYLHILNFAKTGKLIHLKEVWLGWFFYFLLPTLIAIVFLSIPKIKKEFK